MQNSMDVNQELEAARQRISELEELNANLRSTCATLQVLATREDQLLGKVFTQVSKTSKPNLKPEKYEFQTLKNEQDQLHSTLKEESERLEKEMRSMHLRPGSGSSSSRPSTPSIDFQNMVSQMSEEILRLRSLILASGNAGSEEEIDILLQLSKLKKERDNLKHRLAVSESRVHELEKSYVQHELDLELDEERQFNLQRSLRPDSPHSIGIGNFSTHTSSMNSSLSSSPATSSSLWHATQSAIPHRFAHDNSRNRSGSVASDTSSTSSTSLNNLK